MIIKKIQMVLLFVAISASASAQVQQPDVKLSEKAHQYAKEKQKLIERQQQQREKASSVMASDVEPFQILKSYWEGNGTIEIPLWDEPVYLGDINGDGRDDFAVSRKVKDDRTEDATDEVVKSYLFTDGISGEYDVVYGDVKAAGDVNADGFADVLINNQNIATGSETGLSSETVYVSSNVVQFGDINSDGATDLLTVQNPASNKLRFIFHISVGETNEPEFRNDTTEVDLSYDIGWKYNALLSKHKKDSDTLSVMVADYKHLTHWFVTVEDSEITIFDPEVTVLDQEARAPQTDFKIHNFDYNGDGFQEYVVNRLSYNEAYAFKIDTVTHRLDQDLYYTQHIVIPVGDMNGDGMDDLLLRGRSSSDLSIHKGQDVQRIEFNKDITDLPGSRFVIPLSQSVLNTDDDNKSELIVGFRDSENDESGLLQIELDENEEVIATERIDEHTDTFYHELTTFTNIGDLNGDGQDDMAYSSTGKNEIGIYFSENGELSSIPDVIISDFFENTTPLIMRPGDVNGDGFGDIAVGSNNGTALGLIYGAASAEGIQHETLAFNTDELPYLSYAAELADLDGDGLDEVIIASADNINGATGTGVYDNAVLVKKGGTSLSAANFEIKALPDAFRTGQTFGIPTISVGDVNGDETPDFLTSLYRNRPLLLLGNAETDSIKVELRFSNIVQFTLNGSTHLWGDESLQAIHDVNGDGLNDLGFITGRYDASFNFKGADQLLVFFTGEEMDTEVDSVITITYPESVEQPVYSYGMTYTSTEDGKNIFLIHGFNEVHLGEIEDTVLQVAQSFSGPYSELRATSTFFYKENRFMKYKENGSDDFIHQLWLTYEDNNDALRSSRVYGFRNVMSYLDVETSNEEQPEITSEFNLRQNYPNPFNPTTRISYCIPSSADVTLSVFNLLGQKVMTLVNEHQSAGGHTVTFDGQHLSSGIYIYRLQSGSQKITRKMTLIK